MGVVAGVREGSGVVCGAGVRCGAGAGEVLGRGTVAGDVIIFSCMFTKIYAHSFNVLALGARAQMSAPSLNLR